MIKNKEIDSFQTECVRKEGIERSLYQPVCFCDYYSIWNKTTLNIIKRWFVGKINFGQSHYLQLITSLNSYPFVMQSCLSWLIKLNMYDMQINDYDFKIIAWIWYLDYRPFYSKTYYIGYCLNLSRYFSIKLSHIAI